MDSAYYDNYYFYTTNGSPRELKNGAIIELPEKTPKKMTLKEQFLLTFKSEPLKSFRQKGITNEDDMLTSEGQQVFLSWLLNKYGNEFKTEVVDKIEIK